MTEETTRDIDLLPASGAIEATTRAEADIQIRTAKEFPLHTGAKAIERFRKDAMAMATMDQETAESCIFAVPRGKTITGPSVRLAEIISTAWGNTRTAGRVVEVGDKWITAEGVCHDLERNVALSAQVRRPITYKDGSRYNNDMIVLHCGVAISIAIRNATNRVIPRALWNGVYEAAKIKATGGQLPIEARVATTLERFALMGIGEDRILHRLKKTSTSVINQADLELLTGLRNAILMREELIDDVFPLPPESATISMEDVAPSFIDPAKTAKGKVKSKKTAPEPLDVSPDPAPESPAESSASAPVAGSDIPQEVFDELGKVDKALANHVWLQAMAANWDASEFLTHHERLVGEGQAAKEALAAMMDNFNEAQRQRVGE